MSDELLDLVDKNDNVIGTVWKSEAHGNSKLIHREIAIAVFNNENEVLLQQRSLSKTIAPGIWSTTAAGHVATGENPDTAIIRELFEELGISVEPVFFKKTLTGPVGNDQAELRFIYWYYAILKDRPELILDNDEVGDAKWVNINELDEFSKMNNYKLGEFSRKWIMKIAKFLKTT